MMVGHNNLRGLCFFLLGLAMVGGGDTVQASESAETVAVIGTGDVGSALGRRFAEQGYSVVYGSRDPAQPRVQELVARTGATASARTQRQAADRAGMIILAVPWSATEQIVKNLGDLSGKIIIDVTNPFRRAEDGFMESVASPSGGELVQSWAPDAFVVKAFNAMGAFVMADPEKAGGTVTVPVAGNDTEAKLKVAGIIRSFGFDTFDVGPLRYAHELEGLAILYVTPYLKNRREESWEYYFRPRPR